MSETTPQHPGRSCNHAWIACALPAALALLCYARTAGFGLVWDDQQIFLADSGVFATAGSIWQWATSPFLNFSLYFRPLALLALGTEFHISGGDPSLPHAINVVLHMANAAMVAALAMHLAAAAGSASGPAAIAAAIAGVFYALHPALIESVSWIAARFDLLTAFLGLAALIVDRRLVSPLWRALAGGLLFFCAALCKEMIVGLALLLPAWHLLFAAPGQGALAVWRSNWRVYTAYAVAGLFYLLLRAHYLPSVLDTMGAGGGLLDRVPLIGKTLGRYLLLALWPFQLSSPIHLLGAAPGYSDPETLLGLLAPLAALGGAVMAGGRGRRIALLAACFLLALAPVSQLLPLTIGDSFAAERYLTLPMLFPALALSLLLVHAAQLRVPRLALGAVLAVWLALAGAAQIKTVPAWASDDSLWPYAYGRAPASETVTKNVMELFIDHGEADRGLAFAEDCRSRQGGKLTAQQQASYARLLGMKGQDDEALRYIAAAAPGIDPESRVAQFGLHQAWGLIAVSAGEPALAVEHFGIARRLHPDDAAVNYYEGLAQMALGEDAEGRARLDHAYAAVDAETANGWRATEAVNIEVAVEKARRRAARAPSE